ncbi:hypothetical protein V6R21_16095 [Limibacter armeniacum]|uniref:hypothetical protein n=1 Tax=Limibacter armeniacum TaxID=466084 RepID=UPI002FE5FFE5
MIASYNSKYLEVHFDPNSGTLYSKIVSDTSKISRQALKNELQQLVTASEKFTPSKWVHNADADELNWSIVSQVWFAGHIIPPMYASGIKKIAFCIDTHPNKLIKLQEVMGEIHHKMGDSPECKVFNSVKAAMFWVE